MRKLSKIYRVFFYNEAHYLDSAALYFVRAGDIYIKLNYTESSTCPENLDALDSLLVDTFDVEKIAIKGEKTQYNVIGYYGKIRLIERTCDYGK